MPKTYNIEPVKSALASAKAILILLPQNPQLDAVAAGLALYLSLAQSGRQVNVGCASQMTVEFNRLYGVDKISPQIGNQNLVISFDYPEDSLEKVAYDKDPANQKFRLTIEPKPGQTPPDANSVEFSYSGASADLIFVVGAGKLTDLGTIYQSEKALFEKDGLTLINLTHIDRAESFGSVNLYDPTAAAACEITAAVLENLGLPLDQDIATNLLAGIEAATVNFTQGKLTADTFDTVAKLMRLGAQRGHIKPEPPAPVPGPRPGLPFPRPAFTPPSGAIAPAQPRADQPLADAPSPDWLKPKVLKSSDL